MTRDTVIHGGVEYAVSVGYKLYAAFREGGGGGRHRGYGYGFLIFDCCWCRS